MDIKKVANSHVSTILGGCDKGKKIWYSFFASSSSHFFLQSFSGATKH